jgi:predicted RNA-binding Zn ribbon-like protein
MEAGVFEGLRQVGGHPVLEFINTVKYRGQSSPNDTLSSFDKLVDWAKLCSIVSHDEARTLKLNGKRDQARAHSIYREVLKFRERMRDLIVANLAGKNPSERAISFVVAMVSALRPNVRYVLNTGTLSFDFPVTEVEDLRSRIVQAGAEFLRPRDAMRVRECEGNDCDWLFIDTSKSGRRRWCSTATCGNRARVSRFRQRN